MVGKLKPLGQKRIQKKLRKYKTVADLLRSEDRWTTGARARAKDGRSVGPDDPRAMKFCLLGAIDRVYGVYSPKNIWAKKKLGRFLCNKLGDTYHGITDFNDYWYTKHSEILDVVRKVGI